MTERLFVNLFGITDSDVTKTAVAACKNGWAVIPVMPGGKKPLCTLAARDRKTADNVAQADGGKQHACGVKHAITDPESARRIFTRLQKGLTQPLNLGLVAHPSRVVVVDADTLEQVNAFRAYWAEATGDPRFLTVTPHTATPGMRGTDGNWVHRHGGHWYFLVPDGVDLPERPGDVTMPGGWVVKWGWSQTLVAPSRRAEGAYVASGSVLPAPDWLMKIVTGRIDQTRVFRETHADMFAGNPVAAWSVATDWADLLGPAGWTPSGKTDNCGCPIWTRPGEASHWKSATAHHGDCQVYENVEQHGPLHVWSDEAAAWFPSRTVTKLQFAASVSHNGDIDAARSALGLSTFSDTVEDWLASRSGSGSGSAEPNTPNEPEPEPEPYRGRSEDSDGEAEPDDDTKAAGFVSATPWEQLLADALAEADRMGLPSGTKHRDWFVENYIRTALPRYGRAVDGPDWEPRPDLVDILSTLDRPQSVADAVLRRSDNAGLFAKGDVHNLFGQSESGKSWLSMLAIQQVVEAGGRAAYFDFEDTARDFLKRMRAMGCDVETHVRAGRLLYANPVSAPTVRSMDGLGEVDLVVIDSLSEVVSAIEGGSLRTGELIRSLYRVFRVQADRGSAVVVIAHASEKTERPTTSLGASEVKAVVTGVEVMLHNTKHFTEGGGGESLVYVTKDRKDVTGRDTDVKGSGEKSYRRLWGKLLVGNDITDEGIVFQVRVDKITHADVEKKAGTPQSAAASQRQAAKDLVLAFLRAEEAAQPRTTLLNTVEDAGIAKATAKRAIEELETSNAIHPVGKVQIGGHNVVTFRVGPRPVTDLHVVKDDPDPQAQE